jgi:hypothetical protein
MRVAHGGSSVRACRGVVPQRGKRLWAFSDFATFYVRAGVRSGAIEEANDGARGLTRTFAQSMRSLAASPSAHGAIRESAAIPPLVALVGSPQSEAGTERDAVAALALLAVSEPTQLHRPLCEHNCTALCVNTTAPPSLCTRTPLGTVGRTSTVSVCMCACVCYRWRMRVVRRCCERAR